MLGVSILEQLEYLLRILTAIICGGLIGFERERRVKSAGLKTHMIVSIGAALMMIVSKYGFWDVLVLDSVKLDPSRIASGIVSAVGFLGAGIIFIRGFKINGVTTAAGLWTTVGVGMVLGAGMYFIGIASTMIILLIQLIFHSIHLNRRYSTTNIYLHISGTQPALDRVRDSLKEMSCSVIKTKLSTTDDPEKRNMKIHVTLSDRDYEAKLIKLFDNPEIHVISMEFEP